MAAVIRAPSVCVCLWCQPKDLVVPLVAGATIPQLAAAVENSELFLRLIDFDFRILWLVRLLLRPDFKLGYCAAGYLLTTPLVRRFSLSSSLSGVHPTWTLIGFFAPG